MQRRGRSAAVIDLLTALGFFDHVGRVTVVVGDEFSLASTPAEPEPSGPTPDGGDHDWDTDPADPRERELIPA